MIAGDLRRVEERARGDVDDDGGSDGGLELSLGLAIGGRSRYGERSVTVTAVVAQRPASGGETGPGGSVFTEAAASGAGGGGTLGRTVSGPPDALEQQRRREMHAMKRQEARRKLEVKQQIRKGGGSGPGGGVARGKSSAGGGAALWRTCSVDDRVVMEAQVQRARERERETREGDEDERYRHQEQQRKGGVVDHRPSPPPPPPPPPAAAVGCAPRSVTPPATGNKSRSGSTTPTEIPAETNTVNDNTTQHHPHSSTPTQTSPCQHPPGNATTPYHFPPIMHMPYPLHPAQYLHFGAAAAGTGGFAFPYVLPCWTPPPPPPPPPPQVASVPAPGPGQPGPGGEPNRNSIPGGMPPSRASSFRPFRQASGNLGGVLPAGQEGVAETNSTKTPSAGSGGMNRVSSLSASQGSSFSAISDFHSDPDPLQGCGYASSGYGDNTQANSSPERHHNHHQPAAVSERETPDGGRASSSSSNPPPPAPPQSDHSASSEPPATATATNANKHQLQPHQHGPPPPLPSTPPNSSANTVIPEGTRGPSPPPPLSRTSESQHPQPPPPPLSRTSESQHPQPPPPPPPPVLQQPSTTRSPIRPRSMPYVSAKGTGPNGRTVTGFLYKFDDKDKVSIVCVCHGSSFTPAEFVRHAGATDVDNPLRHIVMLEELPPKQRVMVPSA